MAALPVTIIGQLTGKDGSENVTLIGMATISGLEVGGGPIMPGPPSGAHPEHPIYYPPSIWPKPGHPAHPIAPGGPPPHVEHPIVIPPEIWPNPPEGTAPHPEHPIVIPPPAEIPNAPPIQVKIVWVPEGYPNSGWNVVYVPTGDHVAPSV